MGDDISANVTYLRIMKRKHLKMYMFGIMGETHAHDYFEVISFCNRKDITFSDMSFPMYYIRHMYSLHIKETEICQKRSKGNKKLKDN